MSARSPTFSPTCCNTAVSTGIRSPAASTGATSTPGSGVRSSATRPDSRIKSAAGGSRPGSATTSISATTTVVSNGSIGEYDISAGFNLNNKFYIGATFGIQSLYQRKTYYYGEDYVYPGNGTDPNLDYQLLYSNFNQEVILDGAGVNFKLGMIYRPIQNLRIGFAFHTPTYYWIDRTYQAYTDSGVHVNNPSDPDGLKPGPDGNQYTNALSPVLEDTGGYNWEFTTPARRCSASPTLSATGV